MGLIPEDMRDRIPAIGEGPPERGLAETMVYVRFCDPSNKWRWYLLESDGKETFFGLAVTDRIAVAGQMTFAELENLQFEDRQGNKGKVMRDVEFTPQTVESVARREASLAELLSRPSPLSQKAPESLVEIEGLE